MSDAQQYLVKMDDGAYRVVRRDANGKAYRDISEAEAVQLREAGLPTRLERAEAQYDQAREDVDSGSRAMLEQLRGRGFLPEGNQGPVRVQRTQVEGGEPSFNAYALDMRGTERKGPLSLEEARYLTGAYPEGVDEVPEGEELVPAPLPQPAPDASQERMFAMMQALRGAR